MSMEEKIQKAKEYVANLEGIQEPVSLRNDAANLYARSYEEYQTIWDALQPCPCEIELVDSVPGQVIEPVFIPEVEIPDDFSI